MKQIKLKINHLNRNSASSYIRQYLNTLGIDKIESFINQPTDDDEETPLDFGKPLIRAAEVLYNKITLHKAKIFIQVD